MDLLNAFKTLLPWRDKRPIAVPALRCVRLWWNDKGVWAAASDLECTARVAVTSNAFRGAGDVVVDPEMVLGVLKVLGEPRHVSIDDEGLVFYFAGTEAHFQLEPGDFPVVPDVKERKAAVSGKGWRRLAESLPLACAKTDERPILRAINLQFEYDRLLAVATDDYRLHGFRESCAVIEPFRVNIPSAFAKRTARMFANAPTVGVFSSDGYFSLESEAVAVFTAEIEGKYPNTEQFTNFDPPRCAAVVQTVGLLRFTRTWKNVDVVRLEWEETGFAYSATPSKTKVRASVPVQTTGEAGEAVLNRVFLQEALKASKRARLELHPAFFALRDCDDGFFAVIMPAKQRGDNNG